MASRRRPATADSLELLLDTICNMFGGVLFMAILIAVLIRTSGKLVEAQRDDSRPTSTAEELHRADAELSQALSERESLAAATEIQRKIVRRLAPPKTQRELDTRTESDAAKGGLLQKNKQAALELAALESAIEQIERETATLAAQMEVEAEKAKEELETSRQESQKTQGELQKVQQELESAKHEYENEVRSRTQTAKLPRLRASSKQEIALILRFGRLYIWHVYDRLGRRVGVNLADMVVVNDGVDGMEVAPKPFAGVRVTGKQADQTLVLQQLRQFDPRQQHIAIIVYPDSFDEFRNVKQAFIELGFEYRLMPTTPGEEIYDHGGRGGMVQ